MLGCGHAATADDVKGAIGLLRRSLAIWLIVATLAGLYAVFKTEAELLSDVPPRALGAPHA